MIIEIFIVFQIILNSKSNKIKRFEVFLILLAKKTGNSVAANHITKQLVQETLMDEGLRVVKELADQIKDDGSGVDLRVFNKINESNRGSNACVGVSSSSPALDQTRPIYKSDAPRPRGRPPKMIDYGVAPHLYHNQSIGSSHTNFSHIQHQLLTNFVSSHIQQTLSQTTHPFNSNGFKSCSASNSVTDEELNEVNDTSNGHFLQNESNKSGISISSTDLSKYSNDSIINGSKDRNLSNSPNNLNTLIAINGNGITSDCLKQETLGNAHRSHQT